MSEHTLGVGASDGSMLGRACTMPLGLALVPDGQRMESPAPIAISRCSISTRGAFSGTGPNDSWCSGSGVKVSYSDDIITTQSELEALLARVNEATKSLQRSASVPSEVAQLVDSFEKTLGAATPLRLEADPYLTTTLWAAAFRAEKALRHDNDEQKRRDVRLALASLSEVLVFHTSRINPSVGLGFIVVGGLRRVGCL